MVVGQLSAILGLAVDDASWKRGEGKIDHFRRLALLVGGMFAGKALGGALLGFNMSVENAKNQVASMLALGSGSTMNAQLENANKLYDMLRVKAAALPGETQDYVNMLGLLAQPMAQAKLSLEDMRDITSGAFVFTKGLGLQWQASARDLADFIKFGKINKTDTFLRSIMTGTGIEATDKGRAKAESLGVTGRAALVKKQTTGPLAQEMAEKLGSSFEGRLDTVKEGIKQTLGQVGSSLFESLKGTLDKLAAWFTQNQIAIKAWATTVGSYIAGAFASLQAGVLWLFDNQEILVGFFLAVGAALTMMMIRAILAWAAVAWPFFAGAALFVGFTKLAEKLGVFPMLLIAIGSAATLMWLGLIGPAMYAVIAVAAIAAAFYVAKDGIMSVLSAIGEKIMWVVHKAEELYDFIFGGPIKDAIKFANEQEVTPAMQYALTATRGAVKQMDSSTPITLNQHNEISISTKDAEAAKKAFDQESLDGAARMRAAFENVGGK